MLRNAVKDHWNREQLPIGSYFHAGGMRIGYEATEAEVIDPDKVVELYEAGDITRDQLLEIISVNKTDAKRVLGGDQVADFTVKVTGNSVDIRLSNLPVEQDDDEFVMSNRQVKTRTKRRVFGGGGAKKIVKTKQRGTGKPKRKINLRSKS